MHFNVEIVFDQRVMMGDTQRRSVTPCLFTVNPIARQKPRFVRSSTRSPDRNVRRSCSCLLQRCDGRLRGCEHIEAVNEAAHARQGSMFGNDDQIEPGIEIA
ncbi:hypothetical protein PQR02_28210 [Paraburkholderia sediminicola]|jgi:hypothetical protein|uniref:Uncharacterized protein n=1 Tax=Paraburkholderia rhynchosiae TaxID=487049 RepID=A0ACC7NJZ6_9BURK